MIATGAFAQKPALRVYSVEDGLKYSQVFTVFQDSRGCIWIGTSYGAARYDGVKCLNLVAADGLPHDSVHQIIEDGAGKIWLMTQLGPARIDPDRLSTPNRCFLPVPESIRGVLDLRAARDSDSLWFARYKEGKLFRLQDGSARSVPVPGLSPAEEIKKIESVGRTLYLCTAQRVVAFTDGGWRDVPLPAGPRSEIVNFVRLRDGLHLLTKGGLLKLDRETFRPDKPWALAGFDASNVFDILPYGEALVALTRSDGFFLIESDGRSKHFDARNGLPSSDISSGIVDRDGMLWLATSDGAVKVFDFSVSSYAAEAGSLGDVYGFAAEPEGDVWVCHQGGLTRFARRQGHFVPALHLLKGSDLHAWSALPVRGGCLVATTGGLLFVRDGRIRRYPDISLGNSRFFDLFMARDGTIWASSLDGLLHFNWDAVALRPASVKKYTSADGLEYNETRRVDQSDDGTIWIGSDGGGVSSWDGSAFRHFGRRQGLPSNVCRTVLTSKDGVWIGTDRGLYLLRDGRVEPVDSVNQKLDDLWIVSMTKGTDGSIWMANSFKVFQIQNRQIVRTIDKSLGLVSRNTTAESCLYLDPLNRLWVGMAGGFSIVEQGPARSVPPNPRILIDAVTTDEGHSLYPGQVVPHTENAISFSFASPTYFTEELTQFQSILQGLDRVWSEPRRFPETKYTNLSPGRYEFKVRALSASGAVSDVPAAFSFEIRRPWWQTYQFRIAALGVFVALVFSAHRLRTRQLRKRKEELELLVQERTKQLNIALNDLQTANRELEEMASLDGLTSLNNQRFLVQALDLEWRRAQREGRSIAFIMADVDHFKLFNDSYGHLAGDDCLRSIAAVLKDVVARPGDLVARYGGEEFLIVLPSTDLKGAAQIAEKVRARIEELEIPHSASGVSPFVTISLGVYACVPGRDQTSQQALAAADNLLYQAKREGRNRVRVQE